MVSFTWASVLPFAAMIIMQFTDISQVTITKAAMSKGLSTYVFVVYSRGLATLLLFPCFILQKKISLNSSFLSAQFVSSLMGSSSLLLAFKGINYSSPTLSSAIGNLVPIFTFVLAVIFRMEMLDVRRSSSQAKVLGTIVSVSGAFIVILYKGSVLFSPSDFPLQNFIVVSPQSNWVLGGVMLVTAFLLTSTWNILQASIVKKCPSMLTIVFFYNFFVTIQSTVFALIMESNSSAWILRPDIKLICIVFSAVFSGVFHVGVTTLCVRQKGPIFIAMFRPLGVVIAAFMVIIFLGDAIYLGSVIGSVIIAIGFYAMIWGQIKEKSTAVMESDVHRLVSSTQKTPLLQCRTSEGDCEKEKIEMVSFTWGNALPYAAMVMMAFTDISILTMSKAAMSKGLSIYVLVTYSHVLSTILLFPCFILQKKISITFSFLGAQILSSLIGGSSLFLAYNGINYSSPTLASAIGNLLPIFTFILAIIFRMEKLDLRNSSCKAKVLGTVISVSGAFVVILYKGSMLFSPSNFSDQNFIIMVSQQSNWVLGGVMLVIGCILNSIWTILQTSIARNCPSKLTIVFFYLIFETIQFTVLSLYMERNSNAWILRPDIKLFSIVFTAVFGGVFHIGVVTWCLSQKGPIFVAMFTPLAVAIAAVMAFIFLSDAVYLGSVIGSVIIAIGFYAMIWGQMKEKTTAVVDNDVHSLVPSNEKTPLLQCRTSAGVV